MRRDLGRRPPARGARDRAAAWPIIALALWLGVLVAAPAGAQAPSLFEQVTIDAGSAWAGAPASPAGGGPSDPRAALALARLRQGLATLSGAGAAPALRPRAPDEVAQAAQDLRRRVGSAVEVRLHPAGTPRHIRGGILEPAAGTPGPIQDERTARAFLRRNRAMLRLEDPDRELLLEQRDTDDLGRRHLRFSQAHRGLPVWPSGLIVHLDPAGNVDVVDGAFIPTPRRVGTQPVVDGDGAAALAQAHLGGRDGLAASGPTLIVYGPGDRPARLAWKLDLSLSVAEHWLVVVDALTGAVLTAFNQVADAAVTGSGLDLFSVNRSLSLFQQGSQFFLVDTTKAMFDRSSQPPSPASTRGGIIVLDAQHQQTPQVQVTSTSATGGFLPDGVSAAFNLSQTYDYYLTRHGRNSIDGKGGSIIGTVRVQQNLFNAFWSNEQQAMFFGDADRFAGSTDVVGHELTHGVTFYTAGLIYQNQPGALNEAFSDIFGEMVEARATGTNDWLIGTGLSRALRNLANPGALNTGLGGPYPSKMSQFINTAQDNGGVHLNSTIIGHAYYLLAVGLPGAIGLTDAERIFYRALTVHLVANSQFVDARLACIQSAEELFGAGSPQAQRTTQAFDAVEITDGERTPDPPTRGPSSGPDATLFVFFDPPSRAYFLGRREEALGDGPTGTFLTDNPVVPTRPSVGRSAEGVSLAAFVNAISDMCLIRTDGAGSEVCLGFPGEVFSVAMSPDTQHFAFVFQDASGTPTNSITLVDLGPGGTERTITLQAPVIDGTTIDTILQADAMVFSSDGRSLVYDALNVLRLNDGTRVGAWSIYSLDIASGTFRTVARPVPGLDIGFPALSQTSDSFITFSAEDTRTGSSTVYAANLNTGALAVVTPGAGAFFVPFYTGDDTAIVFSRADGTPTGSSLLRQSLASDRITPTGAATSWLGDSGFAVIYRRAGNLVGEFVTGFYQDVLARTPAPDEVNAWMGFLFANPTPASASAMAHGFLDGPEYLSKLRTLSQFVTILYRVFLEREPDAPGLAGWVTGLLDGYDTALPGFVNSPEFRSLLPSVQDRAAVDTVVTRLYLQVLGRAPNPDELAGWTNYIVATGDLLGVAKGFLRSDEYNARPKTVAEHVRILYRTFLGRNPAPSEVSPWADYLQTFRIAVENAFIASPEFQAHFASLFR